MEITNKKITIVGCGPGSADYLTPAAKKAVANSQVIAGAQRLLDLFPDSSAQRIIVTGHITDALDQIQSAAKDKAVAVLVSGDPGLFSLSKSVISKFGRENCTVIPAVSSVQVAFARAGLDWQDAKIISAHHKLPIAQELNFKEYSKLAILAGHKDIKSWLIDLVNNLQERIDIFICENLTLENESVRNVTGELLNKIEFSSRAIILIVKKEIL
jgi:precorrin-6y C5,15-methyltransferase (decarboxylating) CbiE subunit